MVNFQGVKQVQCDVAVKDPDDLEDLQHRLELYRYSRRIEPPPLPLAMDPAFGPAPPKPLPTQRVMSASQLRSFQPELRRRKLQEQAETRRAPCAVLLPSQEASHGGGQRAAAPD